MSVISTYLLPHPPLIFPEIGQGEENKISSTVDAYEFIAQKIANSELDTVVIVSPHAETFSDTFIVSDETRVSGDMSEFNTQEVKLTLDVDQEFVKRLINECKTENLPIVRSSKEYRLDHATIVPTRFIDKAEKRQRVRYVVIGVTNLSPGDHYDLGEIIAKTAEKLNRRIAFIASGDLSHRLKNDGPYGFNEKGPEFDTKIQDIIEDNDFNELLSMNSDFLNEAGECGYRPLCVMAGVINQHPVESKLLSYEAPFGVGYCVASFDIYKSPLVQLAQATVEKYVQTGETLNNPNLYAKKIVAKSGVFVTIHKSGELRGCIGTISPTTDNIANEIIQNAISAASHDPRFTPIKPEELPFLTYSVDVLASPEPITSTEQLDPRIYGVIVKLGSKQGLLLPNIDGINTSKEQVKIAMEKVGIKPEFREEIELKRFKVQRYY